MTFLAFLWQAVNRARRALYRAGVLRGRRLHRPVISIGNIAAGGMGKTPAVIAVARFLEGHGLRVAVLTRGYGRSGTASGPVLSNDTDQYGDEPVLIQRATNADVIVGQNRYENARDINCDVFVLDDGFQHLQLHRDFDLVIDGQASLHREGRSALRDADAVIPRRLRTIVPENLRGRRVFAFSALADNEQFFASLREAGLELAGTRSFPDHHRYRPADLAALPRDLPLVTTEKDAVKIDDARVVAAGAEFELEDSILQKMLRVARGQPLPPDETTTMANPDPDPAIPAPRKRKRRKNRVLQRLEYIAYRFVARRVASMPDESIHRWGTRLGALMGKVLRRRDRLAMRNLRSVYPERETADLRRILDACWRHFGREGLLSVQMQNLSMEEVAAKVDLVNIEILHEAIARGKGTILLGAHHGSWEVAGLALMAQVQNVRTVARPLDNELLERELQSIRAKTGTEIVDRRKAARALMRGLSENAILVLLPDQAVQPREGVLVPFLGRPAWTTPAPAKMAIRAGSTIVFGSCIPEGFRYRFEFHVSLLTEAGMDPVELTAHINEVISRPILERPELWLWMHDRWKGTEEKET